MTTKGTTTMRVPQWVKSLVEGSAPPGMAQHEALARILESVGITPSTAPTRLKSLLSSPEGSSPSPVNTRNDAPAPLSRSPSSSISPSNPPPDAHPPIAHPPPAPHPTPPTPVRATAVGCSGISGRGDGGSRSFGLPSPTHTTRPSPRTSVLDRPETCAMSPKGIANLVRLPVMGPASRSPASATQAGRPPPRDAVEAAALEFARTFRMSNGDSERKPPGPCPRAPRASIHTDDECHRYRRLFH